MLHLRAIENDETTERFIDLLQVVTGEINALASDIVRLGEMLADNSEGSEGKRHVGDLQAFDLISQNALAQARLLDEIGRKIRSKDQDDIRSLLLLIAAVPFHNSRQRLEAALNNEEPVVSLPQMSDLSDGTDWF